jgi:hypothetical protein
MNISIYLESVTRGEELVTQLLVDELAMSAAKAKAVYDKNVYPHFERLKNTIYLLVETNYVDKVYRDSYYHYYSSKLTKYNRDCIRISLFEGEISSSDFWDSEKVSGLMEKYRGFIIFRPTTPHIIGRSIVSPKALKESAFCCCTSVYDTTANGFKFKVNGFPYSSQDAETISCAETTLWAIMEYFSNKYPNYNPVLPSRIIHTLNKVSSERQVPSKGLNIAQMSFALKEFGFGTRIYSKEEYGSEFDQLLSCYISSGIPLIVAMENRAKGGTIGHSLVAIGHEKISEKMIDSLVDLSPAGDIGDRMSHKKMTIYDYDAIQKNFIFMDDNRPAYQSATLKEPASNYTGAAWRDCLITYFIVPLYPKIYLEAFEAKKYVLQFLVKGPGALVNGSEVLLRFYLASSRTYKDAIAKNDSWNEDLKTIVMETAMPKFIWLAELSTKELIKCKKANGIIILDATEANLSYNKALILSAFQGNMVNIDKQNGRLSSSSLDLQEFTIFEHNLNSFDYDQ